MQIPAFLAPALPPGLFRAPAGVNERHKEIDRFGHFADKPAAIPTQFLQDDKNAPRKRIEPTTGTAA
jgi:hypothetical protein